MSFAAIRRAASSLALSLTLFVSLSSAAGLAAQYQPETLQAVIDRAREVRASGHVPVALFDIDDTLLETRPRTARILAEFAAEPSVRARFPEAAARLARLPLSAVHYDLADTFAAARVNDAAALESARAYWSGRFFTSAYAAGDVQVAGAAAYVRALRAAGAVVVYLTGRPAPSMEQGTRAALARLRFPLNESNGSALLLLKPSAEMEDLPFKKAAFERIASIGEVIGVFENEPANLNAMNVRFPDAIPVFVDTIHSKRPDAPTPNAAWIANYFKN